MCLVIFVVFCTFKETSTSLSLYRLTWYKGRLSPVDPAGDSGGPSNLFQGYIFSGLMRVISKLEGFTGFSRAPNLPLPLVSVCGIADSPVLQQAAELSRFKLRHFSVSAVSQARQIPVPLVGP